CTATSNNVTVTITSLGTVSIAVQGTSSTNLTYCQNQQGGTLYVVQPTSGIVSYQWYADGSPISGATNSTYVIPTNQTGTRNYTVKVTDAGGCEKLSNTICVTVVAAPTVSISTPSSNVCPGSQIAVHFTFTGCSPWHLTYRINNGSNVTVQTSSNPYILYYTITQPTTFTVVSIQNCNSCAGSISGPSSITVTPYGIPTSYFVMGFTGDTVTTNSGGYVLGWPNYAGDGSNFPDGTVNANSDANRPKHYPNYSALNGRGAIYWDGNDQPVQVSVNTGSGISGGTQKTLFIVYRPTSSSLSNNRMVIYKQGDENHGMAIYLINRQVYYGAWNNQNCTNNCTNQWAVFHNTGFTVQPGTNYIFQFVYNGNASSSNRMRFSINGNVYTPSGTPGTSMSYSGDAVSIGGKVGNTRFHDFASVNETNQYLCNETKIAEVLLYNTADASVRDQVWCVLKYKYGFTNLGNNPIGVLSKEGSDSEPIAGVPPQVDNEVVLGEISPNPAEHRAEATLFVTKQQHIRATIIGLDGRPYATVFEGIVQRGEHRTLVLDIATLPSGVYFLMVEGETFVRSQRFIVQH
ncbi:MAG: T9SS type A sorting domain-containing protein, partial [Candidatus Kapabacteria bacterium]|nr:T9SS type A sorting domain-containing protein [Candidatus Kapabacteria bacterium]